MSDTTKLRDLLAKATPGKWRWSENGNIVTDTPDAGCDPEIAAVYTDREDDLSPRNADLILAMREALPALLAKSDRADALEAELAALKARIEDAPVGVTECCDAKGAWLVVAEDAKLRCGQRVRLLPADAEGE